MRPCWRFVSEGRKCPFEFFFGDSVPFFNDGIDGESVRGALLLIYLYVMGLELGFADLKLFFWNLVGNSDCASYWLITQLVVIVVFLILLQWIFCVLLNCIRWVLISWIGCFACFLELFDQFEPLLYGGSSYIIGYIFLIRSLRVWVLTFR